MQGYNNSKLQTDNCTLGNRGGYTYIMHNYSVNQLYLQLTSMSDLLTICVISTYLLGSTAHREVVWNCPHSCHILPSP